MERKAKTLPPLIVSAASVRTSHCFPVEKNNYKQIKKLYNFLKIHIRVIWYALIRAVGLNVERHLNFVHFRLWLHIIIPSRINYISISVFTSRKKCHQTFGKKYIKNRSKTVRYSMVRKTRECLHAWRVLIILLQFIID